MRKMNRFEEIECAIKRLERKKAAGRGKIPAEDSKIGANIIKKDLKLGMDNIMKGDEMPADGKVV